MTLSQQHWHTDHLPMLKFLLPHLRDLKNPPKRLMIVYINPSGGTLRPFWEFYKREKKEAPAPSKGHLYNITR